MAGVGEVESEMARGKAGGVEYAALFMLESGARATLASVIPIQAYDILHNEQKVSVLYTVVSVSGVLMTLLMPVLTARLARRWVFTLGAGALIVAAAAFVLDNIGGLVSGMALRMFGSSATAIAMSLYILDNIRKSELVRIEAQRMSWATVSWTLGPVGGVWLYDWLGVAAPMTASALWAAFLIASFWWLRLSDSRIVRPGPSRPKSPLANVRRFAVQPRLRLAWLIAFSRSCFWTTVYVYGPLLMVVTGQGKVAGGLLVSASNFLLFLSIPWGKAGRRFGVRKTIAGAFAAVAVLLVAASLTGEAYPLVTAGLLLVASAFAVAHDAVGSAPFQRAVRPHERAEMTAVYRTFIDLSSLLPPLVYAVVLGFFGMGSVFFTLSLLIILAGTLSWIYLPKRM